MSNSEMVSRIDSLLEYEKMIEELKSEAEEIRNSIKSEMYLRDEEELEVGPHIVRFTCVTTSRFDTKAFKATMGYNMYKQFLKESVSRRFSIA